MQGLTAMAENDHRPLENGHGRPMTDAERYDADFKHIREMNMKEQGYIRVSAIEYPQTRTQTDSVSAIARDCSKPTESL